MESANQLKFISWTVTGTNDAAVVTPATVPLTETDAVLATGGQLTITDVDSPATFVAQTNKVGQYGTFSIAADGKWTYVASSAHNEFKADQVYTDTFEVMSADGTKTSVTVNLTGTNDAPLVSGAVTGVATEDGAVSTQTEADRRHGTVAGTCHRRRVPAAAERRADLRNAIDSFAFKAASNWRH